MFVNKVNGKVYIGQTMVSLKNRMRQHFADARRGVPILLYNAIRKYGEHNFDGVIIGQCLTIKELDSLEKQLIKAYDSTNRSLGYNIRDGGQGGGRYEGYWHQSWPWLHQYGQAKLTEEQVLEIRRIGARREWGIGHKLAQQFGVKDMMISCILNRRNWKHI